MAQVLSEINSFAENGTKICALAVDCKLVPYEITSHWIYILQCVMIFTDVFEAALHS
jgi:hypothetical protein